MKAIILNQSHADKVELTEVQSGDLKPNEVRVKIIAAALNHRDEWCRQGRYPGLKDGVVMGSDGAGTVEEIGIEADKSWLGKSVIINPAMNWGNNQKAQSKEFKILGMPDNGTFAEFVTVSSDKLHELPDHLSWEEAAALPLAGLTAYRAVAVQGKLQAKEKVLVTGFGGGVAQFAVTFALAMEAEVYVSSSANEKIARALSLGALKGFDYTSEDWTAEALETTDGFDLIIDSAMGDTIGNLIKVAKPGGRIVLYGATQGNPSHLDARKVFWYQLQLIGSTMGSDQDFKEMLNLVQQKKLKPVIDQVFELGSAVKAFDRMKAGKQTGKIVLRIT